MSIVVAVVVVGSASEVVVKIVVSAVVVVVVISVCCVVVVSSSATTSATSVLPQADKITTNITHDKIFMIFFFIDTAPNILFNSILAFHLYIFKPKRKSLQILNF
jgi:hypothetical protein